MKDELPDIFDEMRPHLKSLYAAAQNMEEVIELGWDEEMDDRKTVKAFDVYNFDKPGAKDIISTARHTVDENASQQQTVQIPMIENDDKPNKLTTLIFNIIAIVGVAVVFRLLPRFSQKVHLLYP